MDGTPLEFIWPEWYICISNHFVKIFSAASGASQEDVKGPHAALAVRLSQRDPGRSFVLGERLQYVLLPGARLQAREHLTIHNI